MFPKFFFCNELFAPRYFPKIGGVAVDAPVVDFHDMYCGIAIYQLLKQNAGVTSALLGGGIHPLRLPQKPRYPELVIEFRGETGEPQLQAGTIGPMRATYAIYSFSNTKDAYSECKALDEAVRQALIGFAGVVTDPDVSPEETFQIKGIFFEDAGEDEELSTQTIEVFSVFDVRY